MSNTNFKDKLHLAPKAAALALLAMGGNALGGTNPAEPVEISGQDIAIDEPVGDEKSIYDKIWALPKLYSNPDNPYIQELKLIGRYQGQYVDVDSEQGDFSDWRSRRFRIGAQAKIFKRLTVGGQINIDDDFSPFYRSIDEAYVSYKVNDDVKITVGKHKPKWSYEHSTSSRHILPFERSLLVNQLSPAKATGASISGKSDNWSYLAGAWSGDLNREFGNLDGGQFYVATIGYDFSEMAPQVDKLAWRFDYLYNDQESGDIAARRPYKQSLSTSVVVNKGDFKTVTELLYGNGFEDDAYGFYFMPSYMITEKLELVARYHYAHGQNDSLRTAFSGRFKGSVPQLRDGGFGEQFHSAYAGLNYYLYDHKLKVMGGVEYANMDGGSDGGDFDGWSLFTGVRLYF